MRHHSVRWFERVRAMFRCAGAGLSPSGHTTPPAPAPLSLPHTSAVGAYVAPAPECTCPSLAQLPHPTGAFVVDMRLDKLGQVMGHVGPRLQLRPPAGGLEWEAVPEAVRAATGTEQLRAKVKVVNSRGRWGK